MSFLLLSSLIFVEFQKQLFFGGWVEISNNYMYIYTSYVLSNIYVINMSWEGGDK